MSWEWWVGLYFAGALIVWGNAVIARDRSLTAEDRVLMAIIWPLLSLMATFDYLRGLIRRWAVKAPKGK